MGVTSGNPGVKRKHVAQLSEFTSMTIHLLMVSSVTVIKVLGGVTKILYHSSFYIILTVYRILIFFVVLMHDVLPELFLRRSATVER